MLDHDSVVELWCCFHVPDELYGRCLSRRAGKLLSVGSETILLLSSLRIPFKAFTELERVDRLFCDLMSRGLRGALVMFV